MFITDQCVPIAAHDWTWPFYCALAEAWWVGADENGRLPQTQDFTRAYCAC